MSFGKLFYKKMKIEDLVKLSQQDDFKALEELIKRVQKDIYVSFLYMCKSPIKVQDLTQEALLKMSKNIKSLKNPKYFKSWLNQIVVHLFYDDVRKDTSKPKTLSFDADDKSDNNVSNPYLQIPDKKAKPMDNCLFCELDKVIKKEIMALPEHFRIPIVMREFQCMSYDEISKITNTNVGTVKSRIARARAKLQDELKDYI